MIISQEPSDSSCRNFAVPQLQCRWHDRHLTEDQGCSASAGTPCMALDSAGRNPLKAWHEHWDAKLAGSVNRHNAGLFKTAIVMRITTAVCMHQLAFTQLCNAALCWCAFSGLCKGTTERQQIGCPKNNRAPMCSSGQCFAAGCHCCNAHCAGWALQQYPRIQ